MEFLDYRRNRITPCKQANIGIKNFSAIPHLIQSNSCRNVLYVLNVEQHRKRKNIFRLYCVIYSKTSPRDVRTFPLYCRLDSAAFVSVANSAKLRCKRQGGKCLHSSEGLSIQRKRQLLSGRTAKQCWWIAHCTSQVRWEWILPVDSWLKVVSRLKPDRVLLIWGKSLRLLDVVMIMLSKLQFSWPALTTSPLSTIFTHSSSLRTTQPELPTRSLLSQKVDWWKLKQLLLWAL